MKSSKVASIGPNMKRKLCDVGVVIPGDNSGSLKSGHLQSKSIRPNPTSFSSGLTSSDAVKLGVMTVEPLKKSSSWPNSVLSPGGVADLFSEDITYEDNILHTKFQQQATLLLKHSVFRAQSAGVTKSLHDKACELIAGAAYAYNCSKGTTMLALHLFDRALSLTVVRKAEVTLLASTCLLIAAKLEEVNPPYAEELAFYCGKRFEKDDVYQMEGVLLPLFQCQVSVPTRYDFAMRFCEAARLSGREKSLVVFLLELSFLDYNLNYFLPSKVAAGAIHLAIQMLRHTSKLAPIWPGHLERTTRCAERDLVEVVQRLRLVHWHLEAGPMNGIAQRYVADEYYGLAETPALPYAQLKFDTLGLLNSRVEKELPEYAECKTLDGRK